MQRCAVCGLGRFEHGIIRPDQSDRAAGRVPSLDRPGLDPRFGDTPAACLILELKIKDSEMAAERAGHDRRLAAGGSAFRVDAGQTSKILAGKQQVLMAEDERVNPVEAGEVLTRVLLALGRREPGNPGVTERNDQIDAAPELAELRARGLDDVEGDQASAEMDLVPLRDLRRRDAEHAQLEPLRRSSLVEKFALDHDRRRKPGRAIAFAHIAAHDRKPSLRIGALEDIEAIVEIVVAERRGGVIKPVHRGDDGVDRARVRSDRPGGDVAERRALKTVAIVEQEAVGGLAAGVGDQGRGAREADGIVRAITVIIVRIEVGVQVRDAKEPQAEPGPARASGEFGSSLRQGLSFVTGSRNGVDDHRAG